VREFESRFPDWMVVLSTTTRTGRAAAARHFPGRPIFYYPLDLSVVVRRVLKLLFPEPLRRIDLYCVQNAVYADRLARLGVPADRIHVTGTMKYDTIETGDSDDREAERELRRDLGLAEDAVVVVGGSTHPTEETALLRAYGELVRDQPRLRLVLAPRHPERIPEIEDVVRQFGFESVRRTRIPDRGRGAGGRAPVVLIDTIGELSRIYRAAAVVFIGGSLIPHGGQNMMEAAGLGKAVIFGPFAFNFQDSVEVLLAERAAVQLRDAEDLLPQLRRLLDDAAERDGMGRRARDAIRKHQGASLKNLEIIASRVITAA
jgi:3-deoxy-D-manno-octulosonic-acid transferase